MLLVGCDGGTNASSGVVPELTRKLYDLTLAGQLDEARRLQYDLVTLFDAMIYQAEFPEGFRAAVKLRGFRMGRGRQPMSEQQETSLTALSRTLQCLLAAHGFTDQPVEGCSPESQRTSSGGFGAVEGDVSRITQAVVAELKRRGLM
jgi:4-hydroxy-tetrahydrodipicolinate synthase